MWKLFFVIFSICLCFFNANLLSASSNSELNEPPLIPCIVNIGVTSYFKTIVILKLGTNESESAFNIDLINKLAVNKVTQVIIQNIRFINNTVDVFNANCLLVVHIDNCELLKESNFRVINKKIKYLIVIADSNAKCSDKLQEVGNYISKYDITFIKKGLFGIYDLITFIPEIDGNTCENTVTFPRHIGTCENSSMGHTVVFPQKNPKNLNKCPLRVGMGNLYPFAVVKYKETLTPFDPLYNVKGLDVEIIKIITEYFNASLNLYNILIEENPSRYVNFLPFLMNASLDICTGGLHRVYGDVVEYSGIYARQAIVWIYSAKRESRSWQNLVKKLDGLYIFVVFYACYSCSWFLICTYDKDAASATEVLLYAWGALVGAASLRTAKSLKQRILNIVYLILCIHLSAYISIQFYSFLTIRGPPEMFRTNDDIMASGRTPYMIPKLKYFVRDDKYEWFANTSLPCVSFQDCSEKTLDYNGLTVVLTGYFFDFQAKSAENEDARVLRSSENILTVYYEMSIRKNSPLVMNMQKVIQRLFEAGITERLYKEAIGISVVDKSNLVTKNMMGDSYSCIVGCTITMVQISGVFYIWIIGCIISCCVFVLEMVARRDEKVFNMLMPT